VESQVTKKSLKESTSSQCHVHGSYQDPGWDSKVFKACALQSPPPLQPHRNAKKQHSMTWAKRIDNYV
jgi:hypothetical protein